MENFFFLFFAPSPRLQASLFCCFGLFVCACLLLHCAVPLSLLLWLCGPKAVAPVGGSYSGLPGVGGRLLQSVVAPVPSGLVCLVPVRCALDAARRGSRRVSLLSVTGMALLVLPWGGVQCDAMSVCASTHAHGVAAGDTLQLSSAQLRVNMADGTHTRRKEVAAGRQSRDETGN
jgi:hypothetical protein